MALENARKGRTSPAMQSSPYIDITRAALRRWFVAQCYDSAVVGGLWWLGLEYLHLPSAPFWAILAALLQFSPHFGPVLAVMGPPRWSPCSPAALNIFSTCSFFTEGSSSSTSCCCSQ